jgi:hypothetical protein
MHPLVFNWIIAIAIVGSRGDVRVDSVCELSCERSVKLPNTGEMRSRKDIHTPAIVKNLGVFTRPNEGIEQEDGETRVRR